MRAPGNVAVEPAGQDGVAVEPAGQDGVAVEPAGQDGGNQEWLQEEPQEVATPREYDVMTMPADYTLEDLHSKWRNREIAWPESQRRDAWSITQASRLIESIVMGLPVPPVFFYIDAEEKTLVVDGVQRLRSIFGFFEGYFGDENVKKRPVFRLRGINKDSRLYDKEFEDLDLDDQLRLKNTAFRAILIRQLQPSDHTMIYHVFERLNTGRVTRKDQEIRNCVYEGKLNDLLADINWTAEWRKILGRPKPDERKRDVQLILRYTALFHSGADYRAPMKDFMSRFMSEKRDPSDEFIRSERRRFDDTCRLVLARLGEKPFHQARALNAAVFDSMFVAFARNLDSCPTDIAKRAENLRNSQEFQRHTTHATTDGTAVRARLDLARRSLFE